MLPIFFYFTIRLKSVLRLKAEGDRSPSTSSRGVPNVSGIRRAERRNALYIKPPLRRL